MKRTATGIPWAFALLLLCNACAKTRTKSDTNDGSAERQTKIDAQDSRLNSGTRISRGNAPIDNVDLLLVVDNSKETTEIQTKLREQIPKMIKVLTTGDRTPDDVVDHEDFPPVTDLHLAVVSSDMGLPGLAPEENPDSTGVCVGTGDDGNFLNDASVAIVKGLNCQDDDYPIFLEQIGADRDDRDLTLKRAEDTAFAFGCIATLGINGCGFEMPLESALKALWPAKIDNLTEVHQNLEIQFLAGSSGHGDDEHRDFLRGTPYHPTESDKLSVLAIVLVTNEDDCSAGARGDLQFLSLSFPGGNRQDLNFRCHNDTVNDWGNKYPVDRYIKGFKALRPDFPDLVVFGAIAGIPTGIVEDADGDNNISRQESDEYYHQIMANPLMQETPNPDTLSMKYSCVHEWGSGMYDTVATPARRLTEVAKGFGANGVIRSICEDDFSSAMDAILDRIIDNLYRYRI